jgi:lipoic acid synthetase
VYAYVRNTCCARAACRFGLEEVGFRYVASGPLVRSSYKAGEFFLEAMIKGDRKAQATASQQ